MQVFFSFGAPNFSALIFLFLILSAPIWVSAQSEEDSLSYNPDFILNPISVAPKPVFIFKTSLVPLVISQNPATAELRLIFEAVTAPKEAIYGGVSYVFPNFIFKAYLAELKRQYNIDFVLQGYRLQGGYKFYLSKRKTAPKGLYMGPHVSYNQVKLNMKGSPDDYIKMIYFNTNFLVGYQLIIGDSFAVDLSMGLGFRHNYLIEGYSHTYHLRQETLNRGLKFALFSNFGIGN